jgi:hypothetical protein
MNFKITITKNGEKFVHEEDTLIDALKHLETGSIAVTKTDGDTIHVSNKQ